MRIQRCARIVNGWEESDEGDDARTSRTIDLTAVTRGSHAGVNPNYPNIILTRSKDCMEMSR